MCGGAKRRAYGLEDETTSLLAKPNCPGAFGSRAGRAGSRGATARSCAARSRARAIIGSEISRPMAWPPVPSRRAIASVVAPVPQPRSSTVRAPRSATLSTSKSSNGLSSRSSGSCACTQPRAAAPFQNAAWSWLGIDVVSMRGSSVASSNRRLHPANSSRLEVKRVKSLDIGDVAKHAGVPPSTLRFYEEKGLSRPIGRRGLRRTFDSRLAPSGRAGNPARWCARRLQSARTGCTSRTVLTPPPANPLSCRGTRAAASTGTAGSPSGRRCKTAATPRR
jgi:MerR family regulatory protein